VTSILLRILQTIFSMGIKQEVRHVEIRQLLQSVIERLKRIEDILIPGPAVEIVFTAHRETGKTQDEVTQMDLRDDENVVLTIQPVDNKRKPAPVDGVPVWAGSDDTVLTVAAAADGMSATVSGVSPGTARVVVTADADLGAGVTPIVGSLAFNVTGGAAVAVIITASAPIVQGTPPPTQ
jgi:hypothetical protein